MGVISTGPGSPLSFSSASGGKVYGYNNINTFIGLIAPANTARQQILFHNPGTVDIYILPGKIVNSGSNANNTASPGALGGSFIIYQNGGTLTITGECQDQWFAFATGGTAALTVMDSNI